MALTVADLLVRLRADTTQFRSAMEASSKRMHKIGTRMSEVGGKMTTSVSLPLIGIGAAAVKMAGDFEMSLAKMKGLVGVADTEISEFKDTIFEVSKATGEAAGELADAAFFITSAGLTGKRAAAGIRALEASALAASAGMGKTATIADAATSAMNAYGEANLDAEQAVAVLVNAVKAGKAEAASIAPVLGSVIPVASELGVSFDQVAGAIAAMTRTGASAAEASTSIRSALMALQKPAESSKEVLAEFGLTFADLRAELREKGLLSVLQTLKRRFGDNETAMAAVIPNVRALAGVMSLVGKNADETEKVFATLAATTKGDLYDAADATAETGIKKLSKAFNDLKVSVMQLGEIILPTLVPIFRAFADVVGGLVNAIRMLPEPMQGFVGALGVMAALAGPLIVTIGNLSQITAAFGLTMGTTAIKAAALNLSLSKLKVLMFNPATFGGAGLAMKGLAAGIVLVMSYKLTRWFLENTAAGRKLDEMFGALADKVVGFADSLGGEHEKAYRNSIDGYNKLREKLKLTGDEWKVSAEYSRENAILLEKLKTKATEYASSLNKVAAEQRAVNEADSVNEAQRRIDAIKAKAAAQKEYVDTLKDEYAVFSGDDIRKNMDTMVKQFEALKNQGIDMKQLSGAFGDDLLGWVELAKENKIELPQGVRAMSEELKKGAEPEMKKLLDAVSEDFPRHVNAMPGKLLPAFAEISESVGGALSGGWGAGVEKITNGEDSDILKSAISNQLENGVADGVVLGDEKLKEWRTRQEAEAMTIHIKPDFSEFDREWEYRSHGYVPETGAP